MPAKALLRADIYALNMLQLLHLLLSRAADCCSSSDLAAAGAAIPLLVQALQDGRAAPMLDEPVSPPDSMRVVAAVTLGDLARAGLQQQLHQAHAAEVLLNVGVSSSSGGATSATSGDVSTPPTADEAAHALIELHHLLFRCVEDQVHVLHAGHCAVTCALVVLAARRQ